MKKMMTCMMAFMLNGCAGYAITPIKKQIASDLNYIMENKDCAQTCEQVKAYIKTKLADYQSK